MILNQSEDWKSLLMDGVYENNVYGENNIVDH